MSSNDSFSWGAESLSRSGPEGRRSRRRAKPVSATRSLLALRAEAVIIDGFVLLVPVLLCVYLLSLAFPHHGFFYTHAGAVARSGSYASFGLSLPGALVVSSLSLSYFFVCEALRGQTIGKRRRGLRVRAASGGPAGLNAVSARTVLRLIDGIAIYLVGTLVALLSGSRSRRIGDWLGGTVVVRDEGDLDDLVRPVLWRVMIYPVTWMAAVLVVVFALGLGNAAGSAEEAVSLARSYAKARQQGDAALACSLLSGEQQRELVAIRSGDYAGAEASRCSQYVLTEDVRSPLLNPELPQLLEGPVNVQYSALGAALVSSRAFPQVGLMAVKEGDRFKLDSRGLQRLEFIRGCDSQGRLSAAQCGCTFAVLREQGLLERRYGLDVAEAVRRDGRACLRGG
jgi:uncharacterized RDD family membrane protein YckC